MARAKQLPKVKIPKLTLPKVKALRFGKIKTKIPKR